MPKPETAKRGRPPLPEGEARGVTIQIKVTVAEAEAIDAARGAESRSAWGRNALVQAATRKRGK